MLTCHDYQCAQILRRSRPLTPIFDSTKIRDRRKHGHLLSGRGADASRPVLLSGMYSAA
jgi:hypothetical protein